MKILSKHGYNIDYEENIPKDANTIIIAMHGFCSDKTSVCISQLQKEAQKNNLGLVKFDWPAHGKSDASDENLKVSNCLDDLDIIVNFEKAKNPSAAFVAFASSFGGYMAMLYNSMYPLAFDYIILRSPALNMFDVLNNNIMDEYMHEQMLTQGFFLHGFKRKINISSAFVNELYTNNIENLYEGKILKNVAIIHGNIDEIVPYDDSKEFSKKHYTELYMVKDADHKYTKPGQIDEVVNITINIIKDKLK